jgi:hypothetical protein
MTIEQLLAEASWRLRAYFGSDQVDPDRVGWRFAPVLCPVAEWLDFEQLRAHDERMHLPSVGPDDIVYDGEVIMTPLLLTTFVDLIDAATCAPNAWLAASARVSQQEALAALAEAERCCTSWLLPARAQSLQCAYSWPGHGRCQASGITPEIHGFLMCDPNPHSRPGRLDCWTFTGRLCARHLAHLVMPPASWWPEEHEGEQVAQVREAVLV